MGRRNKGTGTSDHPELLLQYGSEDAMADLAKEDEVELSVTVTDSGSQITEDEVEENLRENLYKSFVDRLRENALSQLAQRLGRAGFLGTRLKQLK